MINQFQCTYCKGKLKWVKKVPYTYRQSSIYFCLVCNLLQTRYGLKYNNSLDPHSTKFKGKRLISLSSGTRFGNIRHGKSVRFFHHKRYLSDIIQEYNIKSVFDDGANRGSFARFARLKNLEYHGCEPDFLCFSSYNKKTPKIINCKTQDFLINKKIDFIYSSHTLEHVDNLFIHLTKLDKILKLNGLFFLEVPNTQQIYSNKSNNILEEYFVDKHLQHFFPENIIKIFQNFNLSPLIIKSNQYNFSSLFIKNNLNQKNKNFFFTKLLKNYYTRKNQIKKILKKVAFHINLKKKNNKIIFYGGGKILSSLFNAGLSNNNVLFAVDNFLYDKIKNNNLIPIFSSKKLNNTSKVISIIILARNAEKEIFAELKRKRFKNIILISDLIKKYE